MISKLQPYPTFRETGQNWLRSVPSDWKMLEGKRLFASRREPSSGGDPQLAASQQYGVVPQEMMMKLNDAKVMLALSGTSTFRHVERGDFVISLRSFEGGVEYSDYEGCVSPAYTVLGPRMTIAHAYYRYLFKCGPYVAALQSTTDSLRDGKAISYAQFGGIHLPFPGLREQAQIARFLDYETAKIDQLIEKQQDLIALLKEKRQAVISHAVTKGLNPSAPMKDSGVEWLGQVPAHWEVKHLHHIVDPDRQVMYGIVLPGPDVDEGVPIVKGGDVKPNRLTLARLKRTTVEIEKRYVRSRLKGDDLVYAIRGGVGDVELVPREIEGANLTQDAARIAPGTGILSGWLLMALKGDSFWRQIERKVTGATVRGINIYDLKRGMVAVPPFSEQMSIRDFLGARLEQLDRLEGNLQQFLRTIQERRTALISAAVTGKIDVRGWKPPEGDDEREVA